MKLTDELVNAISQPYFTIKQRLTKTASLFNSVKLTNFDRMRIALVAILMILLCTPSSVAGGDKKLLKTKREASVKADRDREIMDKLLAIEKSIPDNPEAAIKELSNIVTLAIEQDLKKVFRLCLSIARSLLQNSARTYPCAQFYGAGERAIRKAKYAHQQNIL